jgi:phosphoribosylformimino-5-aminoimidazole carboxamide ribotide isomerase
VRPRDGAGVNLYPAIDILGGNAVRLIKGDFEAKKVYDQDPLSAARAFAQEGARYLHVVDLDGAKSGEPVNIEQLRAIVAEVGLPVQFGGGLRTTAAIDAALAAGATRVMIGTAAFTAPEVLVHALHEHDPDRIVVSVDAREGLVATHGWLSTTDVPVGEAIARLREEGVRLFVYTNIDHDGMLDGPDLQDATAAVQAAGDGNLILSGGVGTLEHLRALKELPLNGVIVGKALYEQRFTVAEAIATLAG